MTIQPMWKLQVNFLNLIQISTIVPEMERRDKQLQIMDLRIWEIASGKRHIIREIVKFYLPLPARSFSRILFQPLSTPSYR